MRIAHTYVGEVKNHNHVDISKRPIPEIIQNKRKRA